MSVKCFMNRMIIYFNVLVALMKDCISSNLNGTGVINLKRRSKLKNT
jgi:hypothetical protein